MGTTEVILSISSSVIELLGDDCKEQIATTHSSQSVPFSKHIFKNHRFGWSLRAIAGAVNRKREIHEFKQF
jgi:hypothetical protein